MRRLIRCLWAVGILVSLPAGAWADWTRLRSANFLFVGDASERQLRQTATRLEQFREVMRRALPAAAATSPVPTIVIVFQRDRSFTPFKPQFQGRTTDVAGFFLGGEDLNYLVVNIEHGEVGFSTVFHEYSHFLIGNSLGTVPVWAGEGIAQFYESFEERDGGRVAIIGTPIREHLAVLRDSTPIPLRDLIAVDSRSPIYNEGNRRGVFYAQSWALVHYLILGNKARTPQFLDYLTRLRAGSAPERAFADAFGGDPAALDKELRNYISQVSMTALRMAFDDRVGGSIADRGEKIDDLDADVYLGDLQARLERTDEARARLQKVLERRPGTARATSALGLIEMRAGRLDSALALLERAATEGPDDGQVQGAFGLALIARLGGLQPDSAEYSTTLRRARTVLARAVELDPEGARSAALLGFAELAAGEDLARAATLLTRAASMAPAREQYRVMLAQVFLRQGEFERATDILGGVLANGSDAAVRENARELLGLVAAARASARPAPPAASAVSAVPRPETPRSSVAERSSAVSSARTTEAATTPPAARGPFYIPALRPVAAGETRVLGAFTGIVCGRELTVLAIQTAGPLLRLRQDPARRPDFISYVPNPPSAIGCGPINPPHRVLATYTPTARPSTAFDGDAVAIELIPDDFTPP